MYRKGFTFVETIVVVAMMSVMVGSGLVYFSNFSTKQDLDKARNKLVNQVKMARSYARTSIKPAGQSQELRYVKLVVDGNGNAVITSDVGNTYSTTPVVGGNIELNTAIANCDLCFAAGNGKLVDETAASKPFNFSLQINFISKKDEFEVRSLTVNSSGMVNEQ